MAASWWGNLARYEARAVWRLRSGRYGVAGWPTVVSCSRGCVQMGPGIPDATAGLRLGGPWHRAAPLQRGR
jgi:hypothetical protein